MQDETLYKGSYTLQTWEAMHLLVDVHSNEERRGSDHDGDHLCGVDDAEAATAELYCTNIAFCPPAPSRSCSTFAAGPPWRLEVVPVAPRLVRADLVGSNPR